MRAPAAPGSTAPAAPRSARRRRRSARRFERLLRRRHSPRWTRSPAPPAAPPFQRKVWAALRDHPGRRDPSYGQLAAAIGKPTAVRAVGLANGANPIAIVVPCHRVIGADGSLTGFGGGLDRKRWLLEHEGAKARLAA